MRSTARDDGAACSGSHRPIDRRKKDQLVAFDVDGERLGGLDRGAAVERPGQSDEAGAADRVDLAIAGPHISEAELGCRAYDKRVVGLAGRWRHRIAASSRRPLRAARDAAAQQAAQRIGDHEVDQQQQQGGGQERRAQIDLGARAVEAARAQCRPAGLDRRQARRSRPTG